MTPISSRKRKIEEISSCDAHSQPKSPRRIPKHTSTTQATKTNTTSQPPNALKPAPIEFHPSAQSSETDEPTSFSSSDSSEDDDDDNSDDSDDPSSANDSDNDDPHPDSDKDEDEADQVHDETNNKGSILSRLTAFLPQLAAANASLLSSAPQTSKKVRGFEIVEASNNARGKEGDDEDADEDDDDEEEEEEDDDDEEEAETDDDEDDSEEEGAYIEMNLDLGILEEKKEKENGKRRVMDGVVLPFGYAEEEGSGSDVGEEEEDDDDDSVKEEEEEKGEGKGRRGDAERGLNKRGSDILSELRGERAGKRRRKVGIEEVT